MNLPSRSPAASPDPLPGDMPEVAQLLTDARFLEGLAGVVAKYGLTQADAASQAGACLREMSATHNQRVNELWQRASGWMTRGYDVLVDDDGMANLRHLDRRHALIFLISHKSYLDEFVLPPALVHGRLSPLFGIAGGNLDFFPLGDLARRNGIVHVRRDTSDAPVYRYALRAFIGQLVANKHNLCWSIEGGRSRTGKLRPPRYGLLRYVADAVDAVPDADPLLIPVSLMYDQLPVHEVSRMASEARGQAKEAENLRWLVSYAAGLKERRGRIYLDFGTPLPLRARLDELRAESVTQNQVERVALDVCHRLNAATPITPTAAVCIALLAQDRALTLDEVLDTVRPLAEYVAARRWPVAGAANLSDRSTLRWALRELVRSGVLTEYTGGTETVWQVGRDQHLIAAVYRNSVLHVLLMRAVGELALLAVAEGRVQGAPGGLLVASRLRELLKFEFFFAQRGGFIEDLRTEMEILAGDVDNIEDLTVDQAETWLAKSRLLVCPLVLRPFLDAYRVVADVLADLEDEAAVEADVVRSALRIGHQWALQRTLASEESVSGEMFTTALKLAAHRNLLKADAPELAVRRREFAAEIEEFSAAIRRVAARRPEEGV
ncbi:MAG TPA: 1-acyl-sn-glycerol-3-phosphate acyltransferase [Sporichthyaceae bacterium]